MQHNPFKLSPDDWNRFLTFLLHLMQRQRLHFCMVRVMVATGMRLSEVLSLPPASILDDATGKIRVLSPRTKTVRTVQVCPELAQALQAYLTQYPAVTSAAFTASFNTVAAKSGLPHLKLHQLRHLFLTKAFAKDPTKKPEDPTSGASKK